MLVSGLPNNYHRWIYDDDTMNQFWELGFDDISYSNDLVDSVGYDIDQNGDWLNIFQIFLANSKVENLDQELFNTSNLEYYENGEWVENIYSTDDITELLSMFKSYVEGK
jgi:hypothetical protein